MKFWLEMSRDTNHGGSEWGFTKCLWCPTRKKTGQRWPWWETVRMVKAGDLVLHLRGEDRSEAQLLGWSTAASDGEETSERPSSPGSLWEYSSVFYRTWLRDFEALSRPVPLQSLFETKGPELLRYFDRNKSRNPKLLLFYVRQSGRIQCQNGGYCSELDEELIEILLWDALPVVDGSEASKSPVTQVSTSVKVGEVARRIGHDRFARMVKSNFGERCCFPDCPISGSPFLVAGHIARWSDHPDLRGDVGNGICMCPLHDKAFELGLFTVTSSHKVHVHIEKCRQYSWAQNFLGDAHGVEIGPSNHRPKVEALAEHWRRHGIKV